MATTLRWLIESSPLENLHCAACREKLDTEIAGVNILDNPDTAKWIKANELVLTSGYLYQEEERQLQLVRELGKSGCCALGIKTRRFFQAIPEIMISEAERIGLPIIELPFFYSFSDIIRVVYEHIFHQKTARQRREYALLSTMTGPLFADGSLADMLACISRQYHTPVIYVNAQGVRVAQAHFPGTELQLPERFDPDTLPQGGESFVFRSGDSTYPFLTVSLRGIWGRLLIYNPSNSLQRELSSLKHAADLVSIKLEQRRFERQDTEVRGNGFMQMLMHPTEEMSDEEILHICAFHGFDPQQKRICLTVFPEGSLEPAGFDLIRRMVRDWLSSLPEDGRTRPGTFFAWDARHSCIFLLADPDTSNPELASAARELGRYLIAGRPELSPGSPGLSGCRIGIGTCHQNPGSLPHSLEECRSFVELMKDIFPEHRVFSAIDGTAFRLLSSVPENRLREIYLDTVAVLARYDAVNRTELMKTLDVLYQCRFNAVQAAKQLYIHRNTMQNRLTRIYELLHTEPDDMASSVNLYLGLCVYKLLNPA